MNRTLDPRPPAIRILKAEESKALSDDFGNKPHILPPTPAGCRTCGGAKTFKWNGGGDGEAVDYDCPCDDQWIMQRYLTYFGVPFNLQRLGWADVRQLSPDVADQIVTYIQSLEQMFRSGVGLFLYGPNGTGKTLLGSLVLRAYMTLGYSCQFYTFLEIKDLYAEHMRDPSKEDFFIARAKNVEVLMMDDPGKEGNFSEKAREFSMSILDQIFRYRVSMGMPTIITTNDTPEAFAMRYGPNIASLLTEGAITIHMQGEDFRMQMRERRVQESMAGISRPVVMQ